MVEDQRSKDLQLPSVSFFTSPSNSCPPPFGSNNLKKERVSSLLLLPALMCAALQRQQSDYTTLPSPPLLLYTAIVSCWGHGRLLAGRQAVEDCPVLAPSMQWQTDP